MPPVNQKTSAVMEKCCYECNEPITNLNFIKCHLCDGMAHMKCFGWARSNLDFVNGQTNLLWFCTNCLKSLEDIKANKSPDRTVAVLSSVAESINCCMNEVKTELGQINAFIGTISEKLLTNTTPAILSNNQRNAKRPRVVSPNDTPKRPRGFSSLISGTKAAENFPKLVDTVPQPTAKFWIYLSRIAPHVSDNEITALVQECVPGAQPIVKKLVRKDADLNSFAFISFKVGIDLQFKDIALDASNWPTGIYFRQFEERNSSKVFWDPKVLKFP